MKFLQKKIIQLIVFKKLKNKNFDILICEINRVDSNMLKKNLDYTLMPEYYYFHDISNQQLFQEKTYIQYLKIILIKE